MLRKLMGLVAMGLVVAAGCNQSTPKPNALATSAARPETGDFTLADFVVGEPVRFQNLTIFPVTSRVPKTDDRFITLDEGLKAGTVEIREVGFAQNDPEPRAQRELGETELDEEPASALALAKDADVPDQTPALQNDVDNVSAAGNDVNSLIVVNHSDKPLYLMPGEVIIGGSQDRTIGNELVVAAHSPPTKVPVYCVEHGRWGSKGVEQTLAQLNNASASSALDDSVSLSISQTQTLSQVAQEADRGRFVASVGQLGKAARVAVQSEQDQSAVWDKVAETNDKSGVSSFSGAFTANYSDVDNLKRLEPYLEGLQSKVAKQEQVVGVLVAINGKIESIDVFESTPLFQKVWPKLLKSYSLDAVNARDEEAKVAECTRTAAHKFLAEALQDNVASSDTEHGVALVKRDGQHVLSFTSHVEQPDAAPAAMGGMGGGMGGVHFSGFAK